MSKKDDLIEKYAQDLRACDVEPDMETLRGIVDALGPSIYNRDSETVSSSSTDELRTVVENFAMKKLGIDDRDRAMGAVQKALRTYGHENRHKYRAVLHYLIANDEGELGRFR